MKNDILKTATSISFPDVDLENVKGVLIDLDNTLYLYTPPHEKAMYATWRFFNRFYPMSKEEFETDFAKVWDDIFEQMGNVPSAHHRMTIFQRFAEEKGLDKPYQRATKANELYFKTVFKYMKKYGPDKKAVAFLKECKKKNLLLLYIKTYIFRNRLINLKGFSLCREEVSDYHTKKLG